MKVVDTSGRASASAEVRSLDPSGANLPALFLAAPHADLIGADAHLIGEGRIVVVLCIRDYEHEKETGDVRAVVRPLTRDEARITGEALLRAAGAA